MKEKIQLYITACINGTACNFNCNYCYRKGQGVKQKNIAPTFNYSVDHMLSAFSQKRLGGRAFIDVIGGGETLIPKEVVPFIKGLLHEGHVVELITNLTLNNRIDELLEMPAEDRARLIVKGSFHYLELKRLNKLDDYFQNMRKIIASGASAYPFLVIYEGYIPLLDEIKEVCLKEIGELPQVTLAINDFNHTLSISSFYNDNVRKKIENTFESVAFDSFISLLTVVPQEHFCYSGEWNLILDVANGNYMKCFMCSPEGNFFENIDEKLILEPIGNLCPRPHCALLYSFCGTGIMPDVPLPTYMQMIDRHKLFNDEIRQLLNFKFYDYKKLYNLEEQHNINTKVSNKFKRYDSFLCKIGRLIKRITHKVFKKQ